MKNTPQSRVFGRFADISTVLLILLGAWLCYLAFSFVREITVWALFHIIQMAFGLVMAAVLLIAAFEFFSFWRAPK